MSSFAYYAIWLAASLLLIAVISALVVRHAHRRALRRINSIALLRALDRYCEWLVAQRHAMAAADATIHCALEDIRALQRQYFPELSVEVEPLFAVHARLVDFLVSQQLLRLRDPEAWLDSDHDRRFMVLWRQHFSAVQLLTDKLKTVTGASHSPLEPGTSFSVGRPAAHSRSE